MSSKPAGPCVNIQGELLKVLRKEDETATIQDECPFCLSPVHKHPLSVEAASEKTASTAAMTMDSFQRLVLESVDAKRLKLNPSNKRFQEILTSIFLRYHSQMLASSSPQLAWAVYEMVKAIPLTSTKNHVQKQCGLIVSGPISDLKPSLLCAADKQGKPTVVKVLRADLESHCAAPLEHVQRRMELDFEAKVAKQLGSLTDFAFIPTKVEELQLDAGSWYCYCLVMPRLVMTLAESPQLPFDVLLEQGGRILKALQYMHSVNLVHVDVKNANIFIDQSGCWFLGDFGSTKQVGDKITSSTVSCYPRDLAGKAAQPELDYFMLGLTLLVASSVLHEEWKQLYSEDVPPSTIREAMEKRLKFLEQDSEVANKLATFIRKLVNFDHHFSTSSG